MTQNPEPSQEPASPVDPRVVRAKLGVPVLPVDVVTRPRLLERLDDTGGRVVLVSAPAGSGKTVLIQDWLQSTRTPVAWISLDSLDNEPARFLALLGEALAMVDLPGMQEAAEAVKAVGRTGGPFSPVVLAALAAAEKEAALVLDDVHVLENPSILEFLERAVTDLQVGPRLILLTRVDPPLPLGRSRLSGALAEVRQQDLRFTREEAAELLRLALPQGLSPDLVDRLEARTEGWAAGIRMAALVLRQTEDHKQVVDAFSGTHEFLVDYLLEEVLKGLDPAIQRFLLETSVLPRFTEEACVFVLQDPEARTHLRAVEEASLFLVSLDPAKEWYRYHHLFAELLSFRLLDADPGRADELRKRASQWFDSQGEAQEALALAAEIEDPGLLVELLDRHGYTVLARSEFGSFARWLGKVPDTLTQPWPMFLAALAWFRTQTERKPDVDDLIAALVRAVEDPPAGYPENRVQEARQHLQALRVFGYRILDRFPEALEAGMEALAGLPADAAASRGILEFNLGAVHLRLADMKKSKDLLQKSYENCLKGGGPYLVLASLGHLGYVISQTEGLVPARHHLESALALGEEKGLSGVPAYAIILYQLGQVHYLAHELEEARHHLLRGLERTAGDRETDIRANVLLHLARVATAEGAFEEAKEHLTEASALGLSRNVKPFSTTFDVERARLEAAWSGGVQAPEAAPPSAETSDLWTSWTEAEVMLQLQHGLCLGRQDEARRLADLLAAESASRGRGIPLLVARVAQGALAADARVRKEILSDALTMAASRGYVMPLVLGGSPIRAVLEAALKYPLPGPAQEFVRDKVLPLMPPSQAGSHTRQARAQEWDLTDREVEVLALLADGRTNSQMAKSLFVSVNTIKTHLKNVFTKLDVATRTEAVQKAERVGLIGPERD